MKVKIKCIYCQNDISIETGNVSNKCPNCNKSFETQDAILKSYLMMSSDSLEIEEGVKKCIKCGEDIGIECDNTSAWCSKCSNLIVGHYKRRKEAEYLALIRREKREQDIIEHIRTNEEQEIESINSEDFIIKNGLLVSYKGNGKTVYIPEGVTEIGAEAFGKCESLRKIVISQSVKKVGKQAFAGCNLLKKVIIFEGMTEIEENAFVGCDALEGIIEIRCLRVQDYIEHININREEQEIEPINSDDFIIKDGVIVKYKGKGEIVSIPEGVTEIGERAFGGCMSLKEINIPKGVVKISSLTFSECRSLEKVTILEGVTEIGEFAFGNCESLKEIIIPKGVEKISRATFLNCRSLEKVTIPEGVLEIGKSAFDSCESLKEIEIPHSVEKIGRFAFFCCRSLEKVTIPEGVIEIGIEAFAGCNSLKEIIIPQSVVKIGRSAFNSNIKIIRR